jgi:methylmalonyl-CoA carboxyltransferase small subunit
MRLKITVDGTTYEVEVEVAEQERAGPVLGSPRAASPASSPAPTRSAGGGAPSDNVPDDKACRSPLSGVVSSVDCEVGDEVQVDQPLLVLEAMKMLTTITSPVAGKIKSIPVSVGDGVKQGQLLVEFE